MLGFLLGGGLRRLVFCSAPSGIRIVFLHGFAEGFGLLAEILLIDNAIPVYEKGHHAGGAVLGGISDEGEALGHSAVHDVILCASGRMLTLARQNMKEIAAIRSRRAGFAFLVTLGNGRSNQGPDRALGLIVRNLPVKAIVLAFIAEDLLGVLVVLQGVVVLLRSHKLLADTDGRVLVAAYSAEQDLHLSGLGVEKPGIAFHPERNWCGPVFSANIQHDGAVGLFYEAVHLLVLAREIGVVLGVLGRVTRRDDVLRIRSENSEHRFFIVVLRCGHQSLARLFWR